MRAVAAALLLLVQSFMYVLNIYHAARENAQTLQDY
jgi:hypothetical protein